MTAVSSGASAGPAAPGRPSRFAIHARAIRRRGTRLYSRFIGIMKFVLPALALALLVLVAVWPRVVEDRFRFGAIKVGQLDELGLRMVKPRFLGIDLQNQPYAVTAESATSVGEDKREIELDAPKADIALRTGAFVAVHATKGRYNEPAQHLTLYGVVELWHDSGYRVRTSLAEVDLASGDASGNEPVEAVGPGGEINAEGFEVRERGARVRFTGRSRLTLRSAEPELR